VRIDRWRRRDVQSAGRGQEEKVIANIGRNRHQAQPSYACTESVIAERPYSPPWAFPQ